MLCCLLERGLLGCLLSWGMRQLLLWDLHVLLRSGLLLRCGLFLCHMLLGCVLRRRLGSLLSRHLEFGHLLVLWVLLRDLCLWEELVGGRLWSCGLGRRVFGGWLRGRALLCWPVVG